MEPKINRIKEVVKVTQLPEQTHVNDPILRQIPSEEKVRLVEYPLNPTKYVNQPVIEPIVEREKLKVNFVDEKDYI